MNTEFLTLLLIQCLTIAFVLYRDKEIEKLFNANAKFQREISQNIAKQVDKLSSELNRILN